MTKKNQHFVPQLYLRLFASDREESRRKISLHLIEHDRTIHDAGIRNQCQRKWFYGRSPENEEWLAKLENLTVASLHYIRDSRRIPKEESPNRWALLAFIALQAVRTERKFRDTLEQEQKFVDIAFDGSQEQAVELLGPYDADSMRDFQLSLADVVGRAYSDLSAVLLATGRQNGLLTSDNPVALYNQYHEKFGQRWGTIGALTQGLQVFFPVTPALCLMLFDSEIYTAKLPRNNSLLYMSERDLDQINALQVVRAQNALYFPHDTPGDRIAKAVALGKQHRELAGPRVGEAVDEEDPSRSLVHQFIAVPNLHLNLSFLKTAPTARRVPPSKRAPGTRHGAQSVARELAASSKQTIPDDRARRSRIFIEARQI